MASMPAALITGASTGLGRELALLCARDGHNVILVARSEARLQALGAEIENTLKRKVLVIAQDLSAPGAAHTIFETVNQSAFALEVLINNAAFGLLGRFWEIDAEQQINMIRLNIAALTELTRLFLPELIRKRSGRIMNVASTAAFQPGPLMAVYYAFKAYVVSFSEALHNEAREFGHSHVRLPRAYGN